MGNLLTMPLLAPLLLLQGWWVRRRVPQLPEAPGRRVGTQGKGKVLRLLMLGDSATAGVGAPNQDMALAGQLVQRLAASYQVQWELVAKTGATTGSILKEIRQQEPRDFDVVLISLGVNDVTGVISATRWRRRHAELRALLRTRWRALQLVICGLPPMGEFPALPQPLRWYLGSRARQFTLALEQDVAGEPGCQFLPFDFSLNVDDMAADGFHPGPGIYAAWGARAATTIHSMRARRSEVP